MTKYSLLIVAFLLCSCHQKEDNNIMPVNTTDTIVTEKEKIQQEVLNQQTNDTIQLLVQDEKGNYTAVGIIDSIHSKVYVTFDNKLASTLKAAITTMEGDGNIRFNQIVFPDKTSDGPFGKELQLELNSIGEHILVIGHSLMADGQYEGKFKVEVELTKAPE